MHNSEKTKVGFRCYKKDKTNIAYADIEALGIKVNDRVIINFKNSTCDLGVITYIQKCGNTECRDRHQKNFNDDMPYVSRKSEEKDLIELKKNREFCVEALQKCHEQIQKHKLNMFLLDAHYTFDRTKITFYFSSTGRVDFRELVKDLAHIFKTRIELFQVGVRDESKRLGGLGICGRSVCCSTFLYDFNSVTIKMAKNQNLNLTPSKISGICGRLLCCLGYENDFYAEELKKFPPQNCLFKVNENTGRVINFNVLTATVTYSLGEGYAKEIPLNEFLKNYGHSLIYNHHNDSSQSDEYFDSELKALESE